MVGSVEPVIAFPFSSPFFFLFFFISLFSSPIFPPLHPPLHPYSRFHGFHGYFPSTSLFFHRWTNAARSDFTRLVGKRCPDCEEKSSGGVFTALPLYPRPSFHHIFPLPATAQGSTNFAVDVLVCRSSLLLLLLLFLLLCSHHVCVHSRSRVSKRKEKERKVTKMKERN